MGNRELSVSSISLPTWRGKPIDDKRASRTWILARAEAMLSHYRYRMPLSDQAAVLALKDWATMLGEFPQQAIDEACMIWLELHPDDKPGPGDIRQCIVANYRSAEQQAKAKQLEEKLGLMKGG